MALPESWNLQYLRSAAEQINLLPSVANTLLITIVSVILIVLISALTAWMMVRNKTKGSNILFLVFTASNVDTVSVGYVSACQFDGKHGVEKYGRVDFYVLRLWA